MNISNHGMAGYLKGVWERDVFARGQAKLVFCHGR